VQLFDRIFFCRFVSHSNALPKWGAGSERPLQVRVVIRKALMCLTPIVDKFEIHHDFLNEKYFMLAPMIMMLLVDIGSAYMSIDARLTTIKTI